MKMSYPGLRGNEKLFRSWSGLSVAEFDELYRRFEPAWTKAERERLQSRVRQRAIGGGDDYALDLDTRLLLVLVWLRHYLSGETLGDLFGVSQSTASRTINRLLPLLSALAAESFKAPTGKGPKRSLRHLQQAEPDLFAIFDATEQSVNKPQDDEQSRLHFSGKQRRSTCKVAIQVNELGLIRQLSATCPGSIHDVTHLRQSGLLTQLSQETVAVADAAFVGMPSSLFAREAGLKVIDVEPLPMIQFSSISTNANFVQKHPDVVERFMKGLLEGIAFFKTRPDKAVDIIQRRYTKAGQMNREQAALTHAAVASVLESKMFPTMQAIANVYQEALRQDKEDAARVNPMELWDMHHLRRLDDAGFIDNLYGNQRPAH